MRDRLSGFIYVALIALAAFAVAAVLTPPDVVSQLSLAIPMVILYEVGIIAAGFFIKHTQAPAEEKAAP